MKHNELLPDFNLDLLDFDLDLPGFNLDLQDFNLDQVDFNINPSEEPAPLSKPIVPKENNAKLRIKENHLDKVVSISSLEALFACLGTKDKDFLQKSIKDFVRFYSSQSKNINDQQESSNSDFAVLKSYNPKDELEAIQVKQILMLQVFQLYRQTLIENHHIF